MGVLSKIFFGILSVSLINSVTFALDNDFKNTLTKIDLTKTGENSYNVTLQTKSNFSQPVKVIKKSDLNYYILLPETKNSITTTSTTGSEIRNITANLYPYAGQEINNGYTKININTTKPINFNVSISSNSQATAKENSSVAMAKEKPVNISKEETKTQKKNSGFQESSKIVDKTKTATKTATPSITVTSSSKTKALVKWNNVSGESGYQVWYSTSKDGTYKRFGNAKANAISLTVTGLTSGKTYYFKVRTYTKTDSGYVYGSWSNIKSVKVK